MTPQELKNSILQLAVQGKLVPQRPEEGSAEELLAAIRAEKQSPCPRASVRKKKNSHKDAETQSDVPADEIPFEIPASWKWVRLGEVGSWMSGATPSRTNLDFYNGNIPWLKTGDLNDGEISHTSESISNSALGKTSVRLNPPGSVLIAMYGATIGKLGILKISATTNQACCACIPDDGIYNRFLFFYLMASRYRFVKMGEGGAQPNISKEKIVRFPLPLPPLAEQKRIVAKIEELLPLCERYGNAYNELQALNKRVPADLQKSLLQLAVQGKLVPRRPEEGSAEELLAAIRTQKQSSDSRRTVRKKKTSHKDTETQSDVPADEIPFEIPASWKWVRLGEIAFSCLGKMLDRQKNAGIPMPYLRNVNVRWGSFELSDLQKMKFEDVTDNRFLVKKGDLVMCEGGEPGRCAVWESEESIHFQKALHRIRFQENVDSYFSYRVFEFYAKSGFLNNLFTGTTIKHLTGQVLEKIPFPLPPLAEQKRIVAKLEELLPLCERLSRL